MKREEFRVVEYNGKFRVQRLFWDTTGCGRRKKTERIWIYVSDRGLEPHYFRGIAIIELMESFKTIEAAWDMVDIIVTGEIIHQC